jgi:predicted O-linked N-acetylglucosamine transferase (SPINDLY family)
VFLPGGYLAYRPPDDASELTELPARARGFVTFGLFQRTAKMRPRFFDAAAEVVTSVPNSRLLIQNPDWTMDDPDSPTRRWLAGEFARRGVHPDRIEVMGARPHAETLEAMAAADIALDTFPFQGQTTTCECLWAGVPVVALTGNVHVARVGSSILQRAGLGELAAADECGYVNAATHLARDPARLADLRAGMRQRLHDCGLLDERRLAAEVEAAYRWMWEQGNKNGREL